MLNIYINSGNLFNMFLEDKTVANVVKANTRLKWNENMEKYSDFIFVINWNRIRRWKFSFNKLLIPCEDSYTTITLCTVRTFVRLIFIRFLFLVTGAKLAQWNEKSLTNPEEVGEYFQGDIIQPLSRNGLRNKLSRWPQGIVHYQLSPSFSE